MTRAEWDKIEKTPGKRFLYRRPTTSGYGTAISYFKYTVKLAVGYTERNGVTDEQFACEQVEEA